MPDADDINAGPGASDPADDSLARRAVRLLLERFVSLDAACRRLLERDSTFHELCEEYAVCTDTLQRLHRAAADPAMVREYSELKQRIESELLQYIAEHHAGNDLG